MAHKAGNSPLTKVMLRDMAGYLLAAVAGIVSFSGLIIIFSIILLYNGTFPPWDASIYLLIFIMPAISSGALSAFITRPYVENAREASLPGAFASAVYGGLLFILILIQVFGMTDGGLSEHSLKELITSIFFGTFLLLLLQAFVAVIGAASGAIVSKLVFFRAQ